MSLQETRRRVNGLTRYGVSHRSRRNVIGIEVEYDARSRSYDTRRETNQEVRELFRNYDIEINIESDGSLHNGAEIILPPISLEHLKMFSGPALIELFDLLRRKGWNNDTGSAGGHMSVGRRCFGRSNEEIETHLFDLHSFMYRNRNEFQAFARRSESRYAKWYAPESRFNEVCRLKSELCGKFEAIQYKQNTIQFRFFNAHISFDQVLARFELIQLLIQTFSGRGVYPYNARTTLKDLITAQRRKFPNAYREYIATLDR